MEHSKSIFRIFCMTVAPAIYAAGVSFFLDPNALAPGGVTGISVILNRLTGMQTGTWILILNLPILTVGAWKFGLRFIISTVYCTFLTSVYTNFFHSMGALTGDSFLAALAGGTLTAVGMGLVFKAGATTGGMDIIVKLLRTKLPYLRTGRLFLLMDIAVVGASVLVFRNLEKALYAGMSIFVTSLVLDAVLYGRDGAKLIYIISDRHEAITARLLGELNIGVTYMSGAGAYSGRKKHVILCVVHKNLFPRVEEIVRQEDDMAFMIITSATEIYGEGYKSLYGEKY